MPDTSKLEKLNRELEKSEKKLRKAINDEKALQHQLKQLTRKERTHRLCTRGGMLESFLQESERLTDDDIMLLLKLIFHRQDTQELLKKLLERKKPETPSFTKGAIIHHPEVGALRSPKAPRRRAVICASNEPNEYACIFTRRMPQQPTECRLPQSWSAPNHTGDATLPLRWLSPATLLWTCRPETPCAASCSRPASFISRAILIYGNLV